MFRGTLNYFERVWRMTLSLRPYKDWRYQTEISEVKGVWFFDFGRLPLVLMFAERLSVYMSDLDATFIGCVKIISITNNRYPITASSE